MNKIRLLFISILTPLFCLGAYSSANTFNIAGGGLSLSILDFSTTTSISNITATPSGCSLGLYVMNSNDLQGQNGGCRFLGNNGNYSFECFGVYGGQGVINAGSYRVQDMGSSCTSFSYSTSVASDDSNDCSDIESELSTCQSSLSGVNSSLSSCQSSLNSCQNNGANCDTLYGVCVENLSGCNSDKVSLQNYNDSLSSQLNECLSNNESCSGTGENGSGLILVNNSLFWYYNDSLLSLPITNNLFLPLGYQGALDSGNVLYINALSGDEPQQYYFSEEDKISIIDILSYVFVFFLGIGVIFSLIKLFKKLFTH